MSKKSEEKKTVKKADAPKIKKETPKKKSEEVKKDPEKKPTQKQVKTSVKKVEKPQKKHFPVVVFTPYRPMQIPLLHEHYCVLKGKCSCKQGMSGFTPDDKGRVTKRRFARLSDTLHCFPGIKYTIPKQLYEAVPQLEAARRHGKLVCHSGKLR